MASFWPVHLILVLLLQIFSLHFALSHKYNTNDENNIVIKISTISAAPAVLPGPPAYDPSPALSPDISPLFPTPAKEPPLAPEESSLPTIPSSPSPPNPDANVAMGPEAAFPPFSGSMRSAAFESHARGGAWGSSVVVAVAVMWTIGIGF